MMSGWAKINVKPCNCSECRVFQDNNPSTTTSNETMNLYPSLESLSLQPEASTLGSLSPSIPSTGIAEESPEDGNACNGCSENFKSSLFKFYNCRNCRLLFCSKCASNSTLIPKYNVTARVCENCFKDIHRQPSGSAIIGGMSVVETPAKLKTVQESTGEVVKTSRPSSQTAGEGDGEDIAAAIQQSQDEIEKQRQKEAQLAQDEEAELKLAIEISKLSMEIEQERRGFDSGLEYALKGSVATTVPKTDTPSLNVDMTCNICLDNRKTIVLFPCGHMVACESCWDDIRAKSYGKTLQCPLCRGEVTNFVRTYL